MPDATPQVPPVAARSLRQRMLHASGSSEQQPGFAGAAPGQQPGAHAAAGAQAFGLVAAVRTLYFALVMFSDSASQSVVNRQRAMDARFLGTAMSVQLLRGALLALVVLALALGIHVAAGRDAFTPGTLLC